MKLAILSLLLATAAFADVPTQASAWYVPPEAGQQIAFTDSPPGFQFDIPFDPNPANPGYPPYPGVTYVMTDYTPPIAPVAIAIWFAVNASPDVIFHSVDRPEVLPCKWRLVFQTSHTIYFYEESLIPYEFRRWFATIGSTLETAGGWFSTLSMPNGQYLAIFVPLSPANWSSVYGKGGDDSDETRYWFDQAVNNIVKTGICFGGNYAAHGVTLEQGSARFSLRDYRFEASSQ